MEFNNTDPVAPSTQFIYVDTASRAKTDATINAIATRALAGKVNDRQARWMILAELLATDIPQRVAARTPGLYAQTREDLRDAIIQLLEQKAIQEDGGLDLEKAASKSTCGWAYNLARSAVPSLLRNLSRATTDKVELVDQVNTPSDTELPNAADFAFHFAAVDPAIDDEPDDETDELFEGTAHHFEVAALNTRLHQRRALAAQALRAAYQVERPIRPSDPMERELVRDLLASDEIPSSQQGELPHVDAGVAAQSMAYDFAPREARSSLDRAKQALASLWDDYSAEEREKLAKHPGVAHTLAMDAVSLLQRPHRRAVSAVLSAMRSTFETETSTYRPWRALTRALLDSWLASETESRSDFDTRSDQAEIEAKRMSDMVSWPERVHAMAQWPGAPLGETPDDVHTFIARAFTAVVGDPSAAEVAPEVNHKAQTSA